MEDNFRNVLIIISVVVIGAIFVHGLWTIRKQKNPYKLKASKEKIEPVSRDFDGSGFDQDGVGQIKVKKQSHATEHESAQVNYSDDIERVEPNFSHHQAQVDAFDQSQVTQFDNQQTTAEAPEQVELAISSALPVNENPPTSNDALDAEQNTEWLNEQHSSESDVPKSFSKEELGDDLVCASKKRAPIKREPVYQQPVTKAKPSRAIVSEEPSVVKKEQIEINFDEASAINETATTTQQKKSVAEAEPQVIVLSVVMPANQQMLGASLLPSLLTLGLKYGDMNIFHRHQDNAGNGEVTFSLANMMKPGSFDLDTMENFATIGVSLFMMLPNKGDPFVVYEQMLNAAKQLAQEFGAQVLDDKRNVLTQQGEQHYLTKIREFDRQNRIAFA